MVKLGDIYWLRTESEIAHPHVVIVLNEEIVTVCAITTNMKKLSMPGIVVLEAGEGNLEKQSIVEVYKEFEIDKSELKEFIGSLEGSRLEEILSGREFIKKSFLR